MNRFIVIFLTFPMLLKAQQDDSRSQTTMPEQTGKHEYSVYLTGGISNLLYELSDGGKSSGGFGFGGGAAYIHNFNLKWGLSAGLEIASYKGNASYDLLNETYQTFDSENEPYSSVTYMYDVAHYRETQNLTMLSIPVKARFKIPLNVTMVYYASGGLKLGIPASASAKISGGAVHSDGDYEYENVIYKGLPEYAFFNGQNYGSHTSKIAAGVAAIFTLETGLRFIIDRSVLYAGVYFDYSLNSIKNDDSKHPLHFDGLIRRESVLNSALAAKLKTMSIGLTLGIGF
jgi:hypothetical protein